jgi:hypothetical protein
MAILTLPKHRGREVTPVDRDQLGLSNRIQLAPGHVSMLLGAGSIFIDIDR